MICLLILEMVIIMRTEVRELLEKVAVQLSVFDLKKASDLVDEIQELLAQPEQPEPVYWENEKKALLNEIDHLTNRLTQPEQEQEPMAWKVIDGANGEFMFSRVKPMQRTYKYDVVIPLYTAPISDITGEELMKQVKSNRVFYQEGYAQAELDLKREPLGLEIMDACGSEDYREGFKDGALYAEKCHGIGVNDDN